MRKLTARNKLALMIFFDNAKKHFTALEQNPIKLRCIFLQCNASAFVTLESILLVTEKSFFR